MKYLKEYIKNYHDIIKSVWEEEEEEEEMIWANGALPDFDILHA